MGREEGEMEWEPSPEALILSQGLPNLTGTICIWEEWITIPPAHQCGHSLVWGSVAFAEQTTHNVPGGVTPNLG